MKANQRTRFLILIISAIFYTNIPAYGFGARHARPVKKMITLTGSKSITVAKIFGLRSKGDDFVELRLREEHDHSFKYLTNASNSNESDNEKDKLEFYNTIELSNSEHPSLSIGPFWFDLNTQGPFPKEGTYRFYSKDIPVALDDNDLWTQILQRLKQRTQWRDDTRRKFHLGFKFDHGNKLWIDVAEDYFDSVKGEFYYIAVTVYLNPK